MLACTICMAPILVPLAFFNRFESLLRYATWWNVGAYIMVMMAGLRGFAHFATKTKRLAALAAGQARSADPRSPVLILRSFSDDIAPVHRDIDPGSRYQLSWLYPKLWTLEEAIETVLAEWGPVVAIGRPGEALPPAGAAREYLPSDAWQERVCELIREVRFVVVILGSTQGLEYEYRLLAEAGALPRLLVVFPPASDFVCRWERFSEAAHLTATLPSDDLARTLVARFTADPVLFTCRERSTDAYRIALNCALRG